MIFQDSSDFIEIFPVCSLTGTLHFHCFFSDLPPNLYSTIVDCSKHGLLVARFLRIFPHSTRNLLSSIDITCF